MIPSTVRAFCHQPSARILCSESHYKVGLALLFSHSPFQDRLLKEDPLYVPCHQKNTAPGSVATGGGRSH